MSEMIVIVWFAIVGVGILGTYVLFEIEHRRRGHDVFNWTRKLVNWLDKKRV